MQRSIERESEKIKETAVSRGTPNEDDQKMVGKGTLTSWILPRPAKSAAAAATAAATGAAAAASVSARSVSNRGSGNSGRNGNAGMSKLPRWTVRKESLLVKNVGWEPQSNPGQTQIKVAAFDFDGTLTTTRSGYIYARDAADWKFVFDDAAGERGDAAAMSVVASRLLQLEKEGYCVCILSNQGAIRSALQGKKATSVKTMMDEVFDKAVGIRKYICMCATQKDEFRKPSVGMFNHLNDILRRATNGTSTMSSNADGSVVDLDASFYVGDAAGREGDHADSDLAFARNVGITFYTPEDFFLKHAQGTDEDDERLEKRRRVDETAADASMMVWPDVSLPTLPVCSAVASHDKNKTGQKQIRTMLLLMLVGIQGSGKSTFADNLQQRVASMDGFEAKDVLIINQDSIGSRKKCIQTMQEALSGDSLPRCVVIDRMNLSEKVRAEFIEATLGVATAVHSVVLDVPVRVCQQRILKRTNHRVKGTRFTHLPAMSKSDLEMPSEEEGSIDFVSMIRRSDAVDAAVEAYTRLLVDAAAGTQQ